VGSRPATAELLGALHGHSQAKPAMAMRFPTLRIGAGILSGGNRKRAERCDGRMHGQERLGRRLLTGPEDPPTTQGHLCRLGWKPAMGQTPEGTGHRLGSGTHAGWGHPAFKEVSRRRMVAADVRRLWMEFPVASSQPPRGASGIPPGGAPGLQWEVASNSPPPSFPRSRKGLELDADHGRDADLAGGEGLAGSLVGGFGGAAGDGESGGKAPDQDFHGSSLHPLGEPCVNAR
jgi:hypothetical protein